MADPILVAKSQRALELLPNMANRHGLIAGATGTGKTVTLQVLAEGFSKRGVPVVMADVKGDLSGISQPGSAKPKISERIQTLGLEDFAFTGSPVVFWDVFGEQGHPFRATVQEMGPLLLGRILNLNETQAGVLHLTFKIADDNGLLLLDMKDLRALLQFVADHAREFNTQYGHISAASVGAIQRNLLTLEQEGGERLFGEPALDVHDMLQTDAAGRGVVNILVADKLLKAPTLYSTLLLWLLSELYEKLPEVGDPEKPKIVFFFDEAHLLFNDAPDVLRDKIEQVVRLIRSKGVGVYFVTQNPLDVPDKVLGQLGNRVQHALRAFSPRDQKAVKAAAQTFRQNPKLNIEAAITQLGVGEALVSLLDLKGIPEIVERGLVAPPAGQIGPITPDQRQRIIKSSVLYGHYDQAIDRESAFEILKGRTEHAADRQAQAGQTPEEKQIIFRQRQAEAQAQPRGPHKTSEVFKIITAFATSAARSLGTWAGKSLSRGVLGSILGGSGPRRRRD